MTQQAYFGFGTLQKITEVLDIEKPERIFLVCGKNSYAASGAEKELTPLLEKYGVFFFNDFSTDPKIEDIKKGIDYYRQNPTEITLAVGGGSNIDIAKTVTLLAGQTEDPEAYICRKVTPLLPKKKIIAIPTTSGAGSEATHFAVVYVDKTKYSLAHSSLLPDYVLIDPQ